MRHVFEATADVSAGLGDRAFLNKKGDELEVSAAWAERILTAPELKDSYKLIRDVPETPEEKAAVEKRELAADLMKQPKEKLVKQAERLDVPTDQNKEPLAEAIAEAKTTKGDKK
jgi:hypothetical protein